MAQLHEREEKFDSFLNKIIILSSKYYYKKQMRINGRENTIIDNEEYSQFLQKYRMLLWIMKSGPPSF